MPAEMVRLAHADHLCHKLFYVISKQMFDMRSHNKLTKNGVIHLFFNIQ